MKNISEKNKKLKVFVMLVVIFSLFYLKPAFGATSSKEDILQTTKNILDSLIISSEEQKKSEFITKLDALEKVIDLSILEAKDYISKVISLKKKESEELWFENILKSLGDIIIFYEEQKSLLAQESQNLNIDKIKKIAMELKTKREQKYLPLLEQVQGILLIRGGENSLEIASKRLNSIKADLQKLKLKNKEKKVVEEYILKASKSLEEAKALNEKAYDLFFKKYIEILVKEKETSTLVSKLEENLNQVKEEVTEEKQEKNLGEKEKEEAKVEGIKELMQGSFLKIKDAYQSFIDLSNFLKKANIKK